MAQHGPDSGAQRLEPGFGDPSAKMGCARAADQLGLFRCGAGHLANVQGPLTIEWHADGPARDPTAGGRIAKYG